MQMAILVEGQTVSKYEVDRAFNEAVLEVVPAYMVVKRILGSDEFATIEGCCVG